MCVSTAAEDERRRCCSEHEVRAQECGWRARSVRVSGLRWMGQTSSAAMWRPARAHPQPASPFSMRRMVRAAAASESLFG